MSISTLTVTSIVTRIITGTMPLSSGWEVFCMGREAMSETTSVTTSSLGCISLICRLPISLMATIMKAYRISVRITDINIKNHRD